MSEGLGILNSAEVFTMPKDEALEKFKEYSAAVKRSRSAQDKLLAQTFKALSEGKGVINLNEAVKKGGLNAENGLPFLAVARADQDTVWFRRDIYDSTTGIYGATQALLNRRNKKHQAAHLQFCPPAGTFPRWSELVGADKPTPRGFHGPNRAPVPRIPPAHRPADAYAKYLIMWEVEQWEMVAPVDPMLLRPLTGGLAVVVAHWDLTPVERMAMGAMLGQ